MRKSRQGSHLTLFLCIITVSNAQIKFGAGSGIRPVGNQPVRPGSTSTGNNQFGRPVTNFNGQSPRPVATGETKGCNCLPRERCSSDLGQAESACMLEGRNGGRGICCINQVVVESRFQLSPPKPIHASDAQVASSFQMGESFINQVVSDEKNQIRQKNFLSKGNPARGHSKFFKRSRESKDQNRQALKIAQAALDLRKQHGLQSSDAAGIVASRIRPPPSFQCQSDISPCNSNAKYRSVDGSCNNLNRPRWGKSSTTLRRLLPPLYDDGIISPHENGADDVRLPLPRDISNTVLLDIDSPSRQVSLITMQVAQFVDHDLVHVPFPDLIDENSIECCRDGRDVRPQHAFCFNVRIPETDAFFIPRQQRCMNFVRSMLAPPEGCMLGPVEQINGITHWLDGSNIYGSEHEENEAVRDRTTGKQLESANRLLPHDSGDCGQRIANTTCYAAGDSRVNEQPGLTVEHTLWMREHNRIHQVLRQMHPRWRPDQLYEESRRIVVAIFQHIVYNEWLPIIIGQNMMNRLDIGAIPSGYRNNYDINEDPSIANEFATSAFRFGHSMVQGIFRLINRNGRASSMRLREVFNSPFLIQQSPGLVDDFVRGLTQQPIQNVDTFINEELSNHLFQTTTSSWGMDLVSLNIQRGRDHAIASYSQLREEARLRKPRDFADLVDVMPLDRVLRLQAVYRSVDDIDAFAGGMAETPLRDGLLGPTFADIVGRQFQRTQEADRFFYDRGDQPGSFSHDQLQEIRKTTMASLLCENTDEVDEMQRSAFFVPSASNPKVPCHQITKMDLNPWRREIPQ